MFTVNNTVTPFISATQSSIDARQETEYFNALDRWEEEMQTDCGLGDIAVKRIKECVEKETLILDLSDLMLDTLPVLPSHIEELNVSHNYFKTLPSFPDRLKILDAHHNFLEAVPVLSSGSSLQELYLSDNRIRVKPTSAGTLRVLDLANNPLCFSIPKRIHHIWLGTTPLPYQAMRNLVQNAALNPDYVIKLWVDNPKKTQHELIDKEFSSAIFARVEIAKYSVPYEIEALILRECANTPYNNYAAASDILRLQLLKDFGGIYMDVDITLSEPLGDILIENRFGQPAVDSLFKYHSEENSDNIFGIVLNNNVIAALENSKDIDFLLEAIKATYTGKEVTSGSNGTTLMDFFKEKWCDWSDENSLTAQIKIREILRTQQKLNGSEKLEVIKRLGEPEKNKRLEALSNYNRNLFSDNVDFSNITWNLKRERSLVRFTGTLCFTGPYLLYFYLLNENIYDLDPDNYQQDLEKGFHSVRKFIKTDIFGQIVDPSGKWISDKNGKGGRVGNPMGTWMPENSGTGDWIAPAMHGWTTEI